MTVSCLTARTRGNGARACSVMGLGPSCHSTACWSDVYWEFIHCRTYSYWLIRRRHYYHDEISDDFRQQSFLTSSQSVIDLLWIVKSRIASHFRCAVYENDDFWGIPYALSTVMPTAQSGFAICHKERIEFVKWQAVLAKLWKGPVRKPANWSLYAYMFEKLCILQWLGRCVWSPSISHEQESTSEQEATTHASTTIADLTQTWKMSNSSWF